MLKNEFQSMIEQYSNELLNISRQSGGEANSAAGAEPNPQPEAEQHEAEQIRAVNASPLEEAAADTDDDPEQAQDSLSQVGDIQSDSVGDNSEQRQAEAGDNAGVEPPADSGTAAQPSQSAADAQGALFARDVPLAPPTPSQTDTALDNSMAFGVEENNARQPADIPNAGQGRDSVRPNNIGGYRDNSANMTYEQFLAENTGSGLLKVQVFSGQQVTPIPNAEVLVTKELINGPRIFFSGLTDISGIVDGIQLPAPNRTLSESPQPRGDGVTMQMPYSQYNITVKEGRHHTQEYTNVPIFDGIKSIQPVRMIPLQFSDENGGTIVYPESEPNDL